MFGVLVFKVGVTLLALLCSEVFKVLWAFICITKLVLKINTRAILTTIDGPKENTTFKKAFWLWPSSGSLQTQCSREGRKPECLSCQHQVNELILPNCNSFPKAPSSPCWGRGGGPKSQLQVAFQTVYFKCMAKIYKEIKT